MQTVQDTGSRLVPKVEGCPASTLEMATASFTDGSPDSGTVLVVSLSIALTDNYEASGSPESTVMLGEC